MNIWDVLSKVQFCWETTKNKAIITCSKGGQEPVLFFRVVSRLPSRKELKPRLVHREFAKEAKEEKFFLAIMLLLSDFIGDFFCPPLSILLVLVAQQGQKWPPWSVCLGTFDWHTAELLLARKAAAVCLACAKTLYVDRFSGLLAWNVCFSNLPRNVQAEPVESQHSAPLPPTRRCQQSSRLFLGKHADITLTTGAGAWWMSEELPVHSSSSEGFQLWNPIFLLRIGRQVWAYLFF